LINLVDFWPSVGGSAKIDSCGSRNLGNQKKRKENYAPGNFPFFGVSTLKQIAEVAVSLRQTDGSCWKGNDD